LTEQEGSYTLRRKGEIKKLVAGVCPAAAASPMPLSLGSRRAVAGAMGHRAGS
jgi:hypothetical protein